MKSTRAKVAFNLLDKPMVRWVVDATKQAGSAEIFSVVGFAREQVEPLLADTTIIVQEERLGTGHAIMMASELLAREDLPASLVVLCGDTPLITPETISQLVALRQQGNAAVSMLTFEPEDPTGYGRVVRDGRDSAAHEECDSAAPDERGSVVRIVEEKDATEAEKQIRECNSGIYCFDRRVLLDKLSELKCDNAQGEYYLTDLIGICVTKGLLVSAYKTSAEEVSGINSRVQLAQATKTMQRRINTRHMEAGVTMLDPDLVWIGPDVALENDVELLPLTMLYGKTTVASGTVIGPNTRVTNSTIGHDCRVDESVLVDVTLEDRVDCGPRAYLRPGTVMKAGSKAGTHVEIKKSIVGEGSKVPHLTYLGDATLGKGVNIGAGTITCNYDGVKKSPTIIGDRAFIGSDTMMVAPVVVGSDTVTGAGSVITRDVPDGALAVERSEQKNIEGWTARHRKGTAQ